MLSIHTPYRGLLIVTEGGCKFTRSNDSIWSYTRSSIRGGCQSEFHYMTPPPCGTLQVKLVPVRTESKELALIVLRTNLLTSSNSAGRARHAYRTKLAHDPNFREPYGDKFRF
jgi:hypothetical protein